MTRIALSIGSNLEREQKIKFAVEKLAEHLEALEFSPVYETAAVGFSGPAFLNLVAGANTRQQYKALRAWLKSIETEAGRIPDKKNHNRVLDIDILLYGDADLHPQFNVPRDEIENQAYVLKPLSDLYPDRRHPLTGLTYQQMWQRNHSAGRFAAQPLKRVHFDFGVRHIRRKVSSPSIK